MRLRESCACRGSPNTRGSSRPIPSNRHGASAPGGRLAEAAISGSEAGPGCAFLGDGELFGATTGNAKGAPPDANIARSPTLAGDPSFAIPVPAPPATCTAGDLCYMNADFYPSAPVLRLGPIALPSRAATRENHVRDRRHPLCPLAHRLPAHRRRAHGAVQLALCPPHRRHDAACASRTPTASARPKRPPPRSSTGCPGWGFTGKASRSRSSSAARAIARWPRNSCG